MMGALGLLAKAEPAVLTLVNSQLESTHDIVGTTGHRMEETLEKEEDEGVERHSE